LEFSLQVNFNNDGYITKITVKAKIDANFDGIAALAGGSAELGFTNIYADVSSEFKIKYSGVTVNAPAGLDKYGDDEPTAEDMAGLLDDLYGSVLGSLFLTPNGLSGYAAETRT
jgi:hypothetical protein